MQLYIIRPTEKKVMEIKWIELETLAGNFVIQPEHAPVILVLSPDNVVNFELENGTTESLVVKSGIAHITRESVTLLLNG